MVEEAWERGGGNDNLGQIATRLKGVMRSKNTIGSVPKKLDKCRKNWKS
jgi:hypothetical protein